MSALSPNQSDRKTADKCTVYWDYENMPIPKQTNLTEILSTLKDKLFTLIGYELPIEYKVYIRASKITHAIHNDFDINAVTLIHVPSTKPEAVDKRLMIDMMFSLYELERDNKSRAIALISGDKDFGHLLSKIHHTPPISHSFLILLRRSSIDHNLSNVVDHVIELNYNPQHVHKETKAKTKTNKSKLQMTLHIVHLLDQKNQFEFKGRALTQIRAIKDAICGRIKIKNVNKQLVIFYKAMNSTNMNVMDHNDSLNKCGIRDGDTLLWIFDKDNNINNDEKKRLKPRQKKKIKLILQNQKNNESVQVSVQRWSTIEILKLNARKTLKLKVSTKQLVLYYKDKELKNDEKIRNYNICDGDTVIWYMDEHKNESNSCKKTLKNLKVTSSSNSSKKKGKSIIKTKSKINITFKHEQKVFERFETESNVVNFVNNLRNKLGSTFGIYEQNIKIMHKGTVLNGKKMLKECGITTDVELLWSADDNLVMDVLMVTNDNKKDEDENKNALMADFDPFGVKHDIDVDIKENEKDIDGDDEWITVMVKNEMNKATVLFTMNRNNSILDLKQMIKQRLCIDPYDQILCFNGAILSDCDSGSVLCKNGFNDGDTISLSVNVCSISMDIEVLGGDIIKDLCFWNNRSVSELKEEISNRCGLNAKYQILEYKENEMQDSYCLYNYGISNGSLIKLTVKE